MKRILLALIIASGFAACNSTPKEPVVVVDTMAIKQQAILQEQARVEAEKQRTDSIAAVRRAERRSISSMSANADLTDKQVATQPAVQPEAKKKGWSDAAKGTAIGAGAGAIAGALIDQNHGQGAIIGGLLGAGSGYAIGRAKDRKTGRVVKKPPPPPDNQ